MKQILLNTRYNLKEIKTIAAMLCHIAKHDNIWLYHAEMGAGKTTLTTAVCAYLGVTDSISSPTYTIVNEYAMANKEALYHFDCYRINTLEEAMNIGLSDYMHSGQRCIVEWAENVLPLIPMEKAIHIDIKIIGDDSREITVWR